MPNTFQGDNPPHHYITEPLLSFSPEKLENGDLRMAFAKAGQSAYNMWGEQAILTEEFLSRDFKTWEGGLVSINHENNHDWVKARMYNLEYDTEEKLVIASFSGVPDWLKSLIYSEDYRGTSQECLPVEFSKNSMDVIKGYGTGCTFVTDPYEPAAGQNIGVGIPPVLAAILASKYPDQSKKPQVEDSMSENKGGGTPAISVETYESAVSDKAELKSQVMTLDSEKKSLETELASTRKEYSDYKSGEADRTKSKVEEALRAYDAQVKADEERNSAISELNSYMKPEKVKEFLSKNPTLELIKFNAEYLKSEAEELKVKSSKEVGYSGEYDSSEDSSGVAALVSELRGTRQVVR